MFLPRSLLLFLLGNVEISGLDLREIQCEPSQSCVEKDQCPEIVNLYAQLKVETEGDKKKALITNLQSQVNIDSSARNVVGTFL